MMILVLLSILPEKRHVTEYEDIIGCYFGYSYEFTEFYHMEIGPDRTAALLLTISRMPPRRIHIVGLTLHKGQLRGFAEYEGKRYLFTGEANGVTLRFSMKIDGTYQATMLREDKFRKNLELLCPLVSEPCYEW